MTAASSLRLFVAIGFATAAAWGLEAAVGRYLPQAFREAVRLFGATLACYVAVRLWMRSVEATGKAATADEPERLLGESFVIDTSTLIDGRIADVVAGGLLTGRYIVSPGVIDELRGIAADAEPTRRGRGRRGLAVLERLRSEPRVQLIDDAVEPAEWGAKPVDRRLVLLADRLGAKLLTHDMPLIEAARARGLAVVNLNDVARALRPVCLPGDRVSSVIVRAGDQPGQGIGYLEDGTILVVEGAAEHVGQTVAAVVLRVNQSNSGRMVFARRESVDS